MKELIEKLEWALKEIEKSKQKEWCYMEDYLLSVSEVSLRLKTNKNFIYALIDKRILKCLIMGSKKIRNSEVNRFLAEYEGKDLSDLNNIKNL